MNAAQVMQAVAGIVRVKLHTGAIITLRPALVGEAAAAGLLPTDTPLVEEMNPEEYEIYKENILDKAKPLIMACGVKPVFVDGEGNPDNGTVSYSLLAGEDGDFNKDDKDNDVILCYLAIMDGVNDTVNAINNQFPQADKDQKTVAVVSQAFSMNPIEVNRMTLPEWIKLLRYARLCGAVKEAKEK